MKKLVLLLFTIIMFSTQAKSDVCNEQVTYGFNKFKMSDYSCATEPQENLTCYSANAQTNNLNVPYAISVEYCKLDRGYKWKAQKFDKDFTVKDGLTTFTRICGAHSAAKLLPKASTPPLDAATEA